ncbi:MAG: hypothetical protein INQ03_18930 [Candidatus Heimdallarchaeota archaeon]|nr:hypothetical protein [Candidatus Heimdallarchaeota archaeon]
MTAIRINLTILLLLFMTLSLNHYTDHGSMISLSVEYEQYDATKNNIISLDEVEQSIPAYYEEEFTFYSEQLETELFSSNAIDITDIDLVNHQLYVLGNYPVSKFNLSSSGYQTLNPEFSFTTGTPSKYSSFFLILNEDMSFSMGALLDFDDEYDYEFVSVLPDTDQGMFYMLALRLGDNQAVVVFKFNGNLSLVGSYVLDSTRADYLGDITEKSSQDLLKMDESGNIIIAGHSERGLIDQSSLAVDEPEFMRWDSKIDFDAFNNEDIVGSAIPGYYFDWRWRVWETNSTYFNYISSKALIPMSDSAPILLDQPVSQVRLEFIIDDEQIVDEQIKVEFRDYHGYLLNSQNLNPNTESQSIFYKSKAAEIWQIVVVSETNKWTLYQLSTTSWEYRDTNFQYFDYEEFDVGAFLGLQHDNVSYVGLQVGESTGWKSYSGSGSRIAEFNAATPQIQFANPISYFNIELMKNLASFSNITVELRDIDGEIIDTISILDTSNAQQGLSYPGSHNLEPKIKTITFYQDTDYVVIDNLYFRASQPTEQVLLDSAWIVKLDTDLNLIWARNYGLDGLVSNPGDFGVNALATNGDSIYLAGITQVPFDSNGTTTPYSQLNFESGDGFILRVDSSGDVDSFTTLGGLSWDLIYDIEIQDGLIYAGGFTMSTEFTLPGTVLPSVQIDSKGGGMLAILNATDFNIYMIQWVGSTQDYDMDTLVADIEVLDGNLFYSGESLAGVNFNAIGSYAYTTGVQMLGIIDGDYELKYATTVSGQSFSGNIEINSSSAEIILPMNRSTSILTFGISDPDHDGLSSYSEQFVHFSNPLLRDTDDDGLYDNEIYEYGTSPIMIDTDSDCLTDYYEVDNGLDPTSATSDAGTDSDADGLTDLQEQQLGTSPQSADSDSDTLNDFDELFIYHTNATNADSDGDGLSDADEINIVGTFPLNPDSDADSISDYVEYTTNISITVDSNPPYYGKSDPMKKDTDNDGLSDNTEILANSAPFRADTDGDGISDKAEYTEYRTKLNSIDSDNDGLNDSYELFYSLTNASDADSDQDGVNDYDEVMIYFSNPWYYDTDGDYWPDLFEIESGTNILVDDEDKDGLTDIDEVLFESDSNNSDTDGDLLPDLFEYTYGLSASVNETYLDLDGDGLTNYEEFLFLSAPDDNDTENDGLNDYLEKFYGSDPNAWDSDLDTISDGDEIHLYDSSPLHVDGDFDGIDDWIEIFVLHSNPNCSDSDGDGFYDGDEYNYGSSLLNNDTDNDSIIDFDEVYIYFTNALSNDTDSDTLTDAAELFEYGTSALTNDTDEDLLSDAYELNNNLDPLIADLDNDTLLDGEEILMYNTDPRDEDSDDDHIYDGFEVNIGTDPNSNDTDGDGMEDFFEVYWGLDPLVDDTADDLDGDGLTNKEEYDMGTSPAMEDTDGDGIPDGEDEEPLDALAQQLEEQYGISDAVSDNPAMATIVVLALLGSGGLGALSMKGGNV